MQRRILFGIETIKNVKKKTTGQAVEAGHVVLAQVSHVGNLGITLQHLLSELLRHYEQSFINTSYGKIPFILRTIK